MAKTRGLLLFQKIDSNQKSRIPVKFQYLEKSIQVGNYANTKRRGILLCQKIDSNQEIRIFNTRTAGNCTQVL